MQIALSDRWEETDKNLYLVHNFTDVRALMDVTVGTQPFFNNTIPEGFDVTDATMTTGQNILYPAEGMEEFHLVINGKNLTGNPANKNIFLEGHRCDGPCQEDIEDAPLETFKRRWSNPNDWPNGTVPVEGEDVTIPPEWDMVYDLEDGPKYRIITINGWLTF